MASIFPLTDGLMRRTIGNYCPQHPERSLCKTGIIKHTMFLDELKKLVNWCCHSHFNLQSTHSQWGCNYLLYWKVKKQSFPWFNSTDSTDSHSPRPLRQQRVCWSAPRPADFTAKCVIHPSPAAVKTKYFYSWATPTRSSGTMRKVSFSSSFPCRWKSTLSHHYKHIWIVFPVMLTGLQFPVKKTKITLNYMLSIPTGKEDCEKYVFNEIWQNKVH